MTFLLDGRIAVRYLAAAPTFSAPTQTQLTAGVDLVGSKQAEELIMIDGWEIQSSSIPTPGYAGVETGSITGESQYPQSKFQWRKHGTSETIYTSQVKGTAGWIAMALDGLGVGKEVEIFPVTVATRSRAKARNVANSFTCAYTLEVPYEVDQAA